MANVGCKPHSMHSILPAPGHSCCHPAALQKAPTKHAQHQLRRQHKGSNQRHRDSSCWSMAESRVEAPSVPAEEPLKEPMNEDLDVSRTVVNASYRKTPWAAQKEKDASTSTLVQVLMLSESNVCRSVLAEAIMTNQLAESGLGDMVKVESRGTRDYSVGEGPDVSVQAAAQTMGLELRQDFKAQQIDFERDIVKFDVVFVMDKFTAADILREVSVYDTINKGAQYSLKVRRLGEFHPDLVATKDQEGQDIGDPLYGNEGGVDELAAVEQTAEVIQVACKGFVQFLQQLKERNPAGADFRKAVEEEIVKMQGLDWLKPPMLSKT